MKREHRVPLSDAAIELLESITPVDGNPYVFPATRGKVVAISDMTMTRCLRRMNEGKTPAPWTDPRVAFGRQQQRSRRTEFLLDLSRLGSRGHDIPARDGPSLPSHAVGGAVERAYARSDLFDRRREMMQAWAAHVVGSLAAH